jgi:tetratricopeptide (TPR) repeat protein
MAKRSKIKNARGKASPTSSAGTKSPAPDLLQSLSSVVVPVLLAVVTFLAYGPSLKSDFTYDARIVIFEEGFVSSLSNLPDILSLKVLGMNLILADRPGEMLYLMLLAAISGSEPFLFHVGSNLLHAANVALLFILMHRFLMTELRVQAGSDLLKVQLAAASAALLFALHPLAVEPVAAISYCSDLLVTFFTLGALLAATYFRPDAHRPAILMGSAGTLCCLAAVTCKESGMAAALLLIVYWFLFRREEAKRPWLIFLGAAVGLTTLFLAARFHFARPTTEPLPYLGGSFFHALSIQPRLWVFMLGKLVWPIGLSADYTLDNVGAISTPVALAILFIVVLLQVWLAWNSRIGALGVAMYWLGLITVSNFVPLNRILADRFYYLPLAGVAMQVMALLCLCLRSRWGFWLALALVLLAMLPFSALTLIRQSVFTNEFSLWRDTVQVSPYSFTAHANLGKALFEKGQVDAAISELQSALKINPDYEVAHFNLGGVLVAKGQLDGAIAHYQMALKINPGLANTHFALGVALYQKGDLDEAIAQYQKALGIQPYDAKTRSNLGVALADKGQLDEAIAQYQKALKILPDDANTHNNLGIALYKQGHLDEAIAQFRETLRIEPNFVTAQSNLAQVQAMANPSHRPK